jgi:tetratricopeptide (TPR) repeat protein
MHGLAVLLASVWLSFAWEPVWLQASAADWQSRIRQLVQQGDLASALVIAEDRLGVHSDDLEARGWRARLLAWSDRWNESEIEYQSVLQSAPHDTDILVGLADLLSWQGRRAEAIVLLDQAIVIDAGRNDVQLRRGRLLHTLGCRAEAGVAYAHVLSLEGLSSGMKDKFTTPNTEFVSQPFILFAGSLNSVEFGWGPRSRLALTLDVRTSRYRRLYPVAIQWNAANPFQLFLREFPLVAYPQPSNGMNYAVRF